MIITQHGNLYAGSASHSCAGGMVGKKGVFLEGIAGLSLGEPGGVRRRQGSKAFRGGRQGAPSAHRVSQALTYCLLYLFSACQVRLWISAVIANPFFEGEFDFVKNQKFLDIYG